MAVFKRKYALLILDFTILNSIFNFRNCYATCVICDKSVDYLYTTGHSLEVYHKFQDLCYEFLNLFVRHIGTQKAKGRMLKICTVHDSKKITGCLI